MVVKIEKIPLGERLTLGEGPHWDSKSNLLYFVDIPAGKVYKYDPKTEEVSSLQLGPDTTTSFVIPVAGEKDKFLISTNNDLKILTWDGKTNSTYTLKTVASVEGKKSKNRLNDGKCDPQGRIYAGTMGPVDPVTQQFTEKKGSLYNFQSGRKVNKLLREIGISNGLAWSSDCKKFYYIDSLKFCIYKYDYDIDDGSISNGIEVYNLKKNGTIGYPDGMTIDNEDKLWMACFNGSKVVRIDPENGELLFELEFPSYQITSVAFGGESLDELYVTSADVDQPPEIKEKYPDFGCLFKVTGLGVKGVPMTDYKM